jgi:hypothetical protein
MPEVGEQGFVGDLRLVELRDEEIAHHDSPVES